MLLKVDHRLNMKILLIPLIDDPSSFNTRNPSDIRRIYLLAKNLSKYGHECCVITKSKLLEQKSDMVITQSRDYTFWLNNLDVIKSNTKKIIFTCSDAIGGTFSIAHNKTPNTVNRLERNFLENICDLIIVGSYRQKEIIKNLEVTTKVVVIEDFVDKDTYKYKPTVLHKKPINIFWEGYIDNVPYLENCADAIKKLTKQFDLKVYLLTSRKRRSPYLGTTDNAEAIKKLFGKTGIFIEWSEANVQKYMSSCHIGIAPLFQNDLFAMAKPANKLIIYNYMGLYAIASAIPAYEEYISNGGVGIIAQERDWESSFKKALKQVLNGNTRVDAHDFSNVNFSDEELTKKYIEHCQLPIINSRYAFMESNEKRFIDSDLISKQHFNTDKYLKMQRTSPHIAYLLPCIAISGGIAVVLKHANLLIDRGYKVTIVVKQPFESGTNDWFHCKAPVVSLDKKNRYLLNNIDILIATSWNTVDEILIAHVPRKIYFVQSDERRFTNERRLIEKIHKTYQADIEYMTEAVWIQRWLKEEFFHDAFYVPNGLDVTLFFPVKGKKKREKKRVLIEGAIDFPYKGMTDAYNAVKDLDCELWIISSRGVPPSSWKYDKFFSNVPMDKMKDIYSSCDVFLKMSRVEGFFGPPLEAMACKCPAVVGKCTGYDEYIKHGVNALVVDVGDVEGAKNAVQMLLDDEVLYNSIVENGMQTIKNWSWESSADYLEKVINNEGVEVLFTDGYPEKYTYDPEFNSKTVTVSGLAGKSKNKLSITQVLGVNLYLFTMTPFLSSHNKSLLKVNPRSFFGAVKHPFSVWVGKKLKLR